MQYKVQFAFLYLNSPKFYEIVITHKTSNKEQLYLEGMWDTLVFAK